MPTCLCKNERGQSGTDQCSLDAGYRGNRRDDRYRRPPAGRTPPPAVAGRPCRRQPESAPRLFADRDRGRRAARRFPADQLGRHLALSRLCRSAQRLLLGICRRHPRHDGSRGGLLPGRRHLRSSDVPRSAPADDADDLILGLRVPAVHRRVLSSPNSAARFRGSGCRPSSSSASPRWSPNGCSCARWCEAGRGRAGSTAAPSSSAPTRPAKN